MRNVKILAYDQNRDEELIKWAKVIYKDDVSKKYFDGFAVHWYASTFDWFPEALNFVHDMVPWKTYLFYNDKDLLETGYPYMMKYIEYLGAHSKNGVLQDIFPGEKWHNLGDWVPPGKGMDKTEWVDDNSRRFFNNCYRVHLLQIMKKVGTILDKNMMSRCFRKN